MSEVATRVTRDVPGLQRLLSEQKMQKVSKQKGPNTHFTPNLQKSQSQATRPTLTKTSSVHCLASSVGSEATAPKSPTPLGKAIACLSKPIEYLLGDGYHQSPPYRFALLKG